MSLEIVDAVKAAKRCEEEARRKQEAAPLKSRTGHRLVPKYQPLGISAVCGATALKSVKSGSRVSDPQ